MTEHNPAFSDEGQWAWDASSLKLYLECPRKYQYVMVEGWRNPRPSVHLIFGAAYADALCLYHKLRADGLGLDDALIEVVHQALKDTWEYGYPTPEDAAAQRNPLPGTGQPWESGHNAKTRETLIRTIVWYVDNFADEIMPVKLDPDDQPLIERHFEFEFEPGVFWCGNLDQVVEFNGQTYIMDQKTTGGTLNERWFTQWDTDTQMSGYAFAGKVVFNTSVAGVIIDAAQIGVGFTRYQRGFTHRSEDQLNEWHEETARAIDSARRDFQRGHFDRRVTSCGNYGGCPFQSVCGRSPHVRDNFLRASFDKGNWNPLEVRKLPGEK